MLLNLAANLITEKEEIHFSISLLKYKTYLSSLSVVKLLKNAKYTNNLIVNSSLKILNQTKKCYNPSRNVEIWNYRYNDIDHVRGPQGP
jgi:hypothetical protein